MPIRLVDYLRPDEAAALADFLVEMVVVEEAVTDLVLAYFAQPGRRDEFARMFLDRMTLGRKVQRANSVLDAYQSVEPSVPKIKSVLKELVEVRNAVAHGLPLEVDEGTTEEPDPVLIYRGRGRAVRADELRRHAELARSMRIRLSLFLQLIAREDEATT